MDRWDAMSLTGVGLIAVGLWFIYWPLAIVVPGVLLLGLGVLGAWTKSRTGRGE